MKSKKFFILALAAAVLFAFAACQPSMPVYRNVDYITINQTEDILVGESATSDMFEIIAHYTDGTAEPVNGVIEVASSSVTASINSADPEKGTLSAAASIVRKTVTSASVSGVSNVEIKAGKSLADLKYLDDALKNGVITWEGTPVLTLSYDGGSKEYTLEGADLRNIVISLIDEEGEPVTAGTFAEGDVFTVTLDKYKLATQFVELKNPIELEGLTVSVVAEGVDPDATLTGIKVYYEVERNGKSLGAKSDSLPTLYTQDKVSIGVYEVYSDGSEILTDSPVTAANTGSIAAPAFVNGKAEVTVATTTTTTTSTVAGLAMVTIDGKAYTESFAVGSGSNYISSVAVVRADKTLSAGHTFASVAGTGTTSDITPTVTWKDAQNIPAGGATVTYAFAPASIPAGYDGQTFTTVCTATWSAFGTNDQTAEFVLTYPVSQS